MNYFYQLRAGGLSLVLALGFSLAGQAQSRFMTREGVTSFSASSMLEDIESRSEQTAAVLDLQTQQLAFTVPVKSFQFKRTLMQEHFNENYMETERYPKATFTGKLVALDEAALRGGGRQKVVAEGDLTIHGVTKRVQVPGTLELQNGRLLVQAAFSVAPADYQIEIPLLVRNHVAKVVAVQLALSCAAVGLQATTRP